MRALDFKLEAVPEPPVPKFIRKPYERAAEESNMQTPAVFESERAGIEQTFPTIRWIRPNEGDRELSRCVGSAHRSVTRCLCGCEFHDRARVAVAVK